MFFLDKFFRTRCYFDTCSTNRLSREAYKEIKKILILQRRLKHTNAQANHEEGKKALNVVENTKAKVADLLNAKASDVIFTSGATESNMLIVRIMLQTFLKKGTSLDKMHMITTEYEHTSMRIAFEFAKQFGVRVSIVPENEGGVVKPKEITDLITNETIFISCIYVDGVTGIINPISKIAQAIKQKREDIVFHTDAAQACAHLNVNVETLKVDALTFCAAKVYGPQAISALLLKKHHLYIGASGLNNKNDMRPGTPPTALVAGFSGSINYIKKNKDKFSIKTRELQKYLIQKLNADLDKFEIVGINKDKPLDTEIVKLAPHILYIIFEGVNHEYLNSLLNSDGIFVANGSACSADDEEYDKKGIRISLNKDITKREINKLVKGIKNNLELASIKN